MCGIAGKIYFKNGKVLSSDIKKMSQQIKHRGPDDHGEYISPDKKVGLGHRRLSIIDLSPLGHQPMSYLNRYWIVFNGEIYNFQEKRETLKKEGYTFQSKTDSEVILALYDKYGKECLGHLRGMFSFAIYDSRKNTLFCARDRVGKKPFKYYLDNNVFIFASELKAILTQSEYQKEPDYTAIHHYLTLQYCPAPLTGFKDIKKLKPAHFLFIDLKTRKLEKQRYWKLDYSQKLVLSEKEWCGKIMSKLKESVKLRMISDVPLGAFLSGGIDSSAVVGLMSKLNNKPIKTFSIGFNEEKFSELKYARMIAEKFNTEHTEFKVEPNAIEMLPKLVKQYEEPYADSSALPAYYVSKMTRDHVTVALNGDGGDENFAGYSRYSAFKFSFFYEKLKFFNKLLVLPSTKITANLIKNTFFERVYRFSQSAQEDYKKRYMHYTAYFTNDQKSNLYNDNFKKKVWDENTYELVANQFLEANTKDGMDQALYADFSSYLPEDLLVKMDIDTMAVSLEGRSPFLDHELLELTAKIPFNLKIKGFNNKKYILKKALEGLVPNEILYRPKMGFGVPIEKWFRGDLKGHTKEIILSQKALDRNIFNKKFLEKLLKTHESTKINHSHRIWALLTLELWFRAYFD